MKKILQLTFVTVFACLLASFCKTPPPPHLPMPMPPHMMPPEKAVSSFDLQKIQEGVYQVFITLVRTKDEIDEGEDTFLNTFSCTCKQGNPVLVEMVDDTRFWTSCEVYIPTNFFKEMPTCSVEVGKGSEIIYSEVLFAENPDD